MAEMFEDTQKYTDQAWQDQANCLGVDPDLFFPERGASTREAKEVCRGCSVRLDCLEYSLVNGEKFGVWGGLSESERRRLRRQRAQAGRRNATPTADTEGVDVPFVLIPNLAPTDDQDSNMADAEQVLGTVVPEYDDDGGLSSEARAARGILHLSEN